jgi:hypothetical protein
MEKSYRNIRVFFSALFLLVIFGFFKTYFGKFPRFADTPAVIHVHAVLFLLWFGLLFIQPWLISKRKFRLHRNIGRISYVLVPLITLSTIAVARGGYVRNLALYPQSKCIAALIFPFAQILVFDILFVLAIISVRKTASHMRYIISGSIILLGPAVRRIFVHWMGIQSQPAATTTFFLLAALFLFLFFYDWRHGKLYKPYMVALFLLIAFFISYNYLGETYIWQKACGKFVQMAF